MDRTVPAGHRIGLVITTSAPTALVDAGSTVTLPVEGGVIRLG